MSQINIGIALFSQSDTSPDPHFSWAIATTSGNWINSEIHTYDIVSTSNGQWEKRERFEDLSHDSHFCGIVEFAHTDLPVEDLDEFIEEHPAEDDGWRVYGPNGWSSAMWALKVMCALEDAAIWDIPPIYGRDALFDLIIGKGFIMLELVEEVEEFPVLQLT